MIHGTSNRTIRDQIDAQANACGDSVFLVDAQTGRTVTYAQLQSAASCIANAIAERDVAAGSSVAFAMGNSLHCAISVLGIMYGGYRATAINLVAGSSTIAYVLDHSRTALILSEASQAELLQSAFDLNNAVVPVVDVVEHLFSDELFESTVSIESSTDNYTLSAIDAQSDGLLMYTSGTTGRPKGVVLTHANLLAGGNNTQLAHELSEGDIALCVLPLYHINGLCVTLMGPLVSGGAVVLPKKFSASSFWPWIEQHGCTWFSVVPTQISYLLHAEPDASLEQRASKSLRFGRSASSSLSPDVQRAFESRFNVPIVETMGLTETAAQILSNPLPPGVRKIGSPGVACGGEVVIMDMQQNELPANTEGEILVRGANVMKGYFENPEATVDALTGNGWLRTGDLGKKDEDGYVFVTGRLKELIIKGGENIAPREVDEALYKHPAVIEAAAFACPCADYGQRIEAAVSVDSTSELTEQALMDFCQNLLGAFKMPDRIYFLTELPKGPSGKIQRMKLAEQFVR